MVVLLEICSTALESGACSSRWLTGGGCASGCTERGLECLLSEQTSPAAPYLPAVLHAVVPRCLLQWALQQSSASTAQHWGPDSSCSAAVSGSLCVSLALACLVVEWQIRSTCQSLSS